MKKIYLIDGNSFIYRMFFALPEFATKDGTIVNALFGMAKFFVSTLVKENPDYLIFVKDAPGDNFRNLIYDKYKATRDRMPDNLRSQIALIDEMIYKLGINVIEVSGFEADDVIGTLAKQFNGQKDIEVDILTGDKDLYSLVSDNIWIYDTMKKKKFGPIETREKFGIEPKLIIDYLAIVGDKADNIPGIDGFGPAKAIDLINYIGTVENIYDVAFKIEAGEKLEEIFPDFSSEDIKKISVCFKGKTFEKLITSKDDAFLSKRLATVELDVKLDDFSLDNFVFKPETLLSDEVLSFFDKYEFNSLIGENGVNKLQTWRDLGLNVYIIDNDENLDKLYGTIKNSTKISLDTETTGLDIMTAELVGISIYIDDKKIYYINRMHSGKTVSDEKLKEFINNIFALDLLIIGHNIKYDLEIIDRFLNSINIKKSDNNFGQISLAI
ncbi:MAG: 5'-3' exonuclease H3TH domain-containing protein [Candidatus Gracilibacteria bacterium]|nr:5'-3' exonuclease H3TH domain-containing protein [Candidatus Gracilibacteria bacterium]